MNDPSNWLDDYCQQWQYDDGLIEETNMQLTLRENDDAELC